MIPFPCRSVVEQGRSSLRVLGGCSDQPSIIRLNDHLKMWFSASVPTGAVGTPGKGTDSLMRDVISKVQGFCLLVHLVSKQNSKDGNWMQLSCISLTSNLEDKNMLAPPPAGWWFPMPDINFCYFFFLVEDSAWKILPQTTNKFQQEQKY